MAGEEQVAPEGKAASAVRAFEEALETVDSSSPSIQGVAASLLHDAHRQFLPKLVEAWERKVEAAASAGDGSKLLLFLYVANDALQHCLGCGVPSLLSLLLPPLQRLCLSFYEKASDKIAKARRVVDVLDQRGVFFNPAVCAALHSALEGRVSDLPEIRLPPKASSPRAQPNALRRSSYPSAAVHRQTPQERARSCPRLLDGFKIVYPNAADLETAAAIDAAIPSNAQDEAFLHLVNRTLAVARDNFITIKDAQGGRQRQATRARLLRRALVRARVPAEETGGAEVRTAFGLDFFETLDSEESILNQLQTSNARVKKLLETEWNRVVELQEAFLQLASATERRMQDLLAIHVQCREAKLAIDRAIARKTK